MGCDNKKYTILVEIDEMLGLNFNVYNNSEFGKEKIDFVGGFGQIKIKNNELTFDLSDIQSQNPKYQNLGFGRMMMEAVLFTLEYYADVNNFVLSKLSGTVGVGSNFKPEKSIKLYKSFDGFNLKAHLVCVNLDVLNLVDRDISYNFINSAI